MGDSYHRPGLYKWKRQEDPRSYSRSQKVTTNQDIQNWIQTVEDASNRAAEQVFGINQYGGRARGKAVAKATKEYMKDDEQAYNEAQDLLSQWMEEKVNLIGGLEPEIDCNYGDDDWEKYEIQSDVKKEWDNLLANNYEEYGLPLSSRPDSQYGKDIYDINEEDAVASVMKNMMDKQVVKNEFKKDLGLDKWGKQKDPLNKMELRHKQVKENREKREAELRKKREEKQNHKEVQAMAKRLVLKEEQMKHLQSRREEAEIRKEMTKIRKQMQEEKRKMDEKKTKERAEKEEIMFAAKMKVNTDMESERLDSIDEQRKYDERQRILAQRVRELEAREAANNLKIMHRHFSAWYNLVLDRRLKMGKARAMYDWKLMLRGWNAWRSYIRSKRLDREALQQQQDVIHTQRNKQIAEKHSRQTLLRKYFIAWHIWVQGEQERRQLEQAQNNTRNKMISLLEAAASGKLCNQEEQESSKPTPRHKSTDRTSTAEKINAMFEANRKLPIQTNDSISTTRSEDSNRPSSGHHKIPQSRIPTEPWQVTRRHLNLTTEEMANIGDNENNCSPEEMNAKVLKKYGRQPWHKREVSNYEHRHAAQKKILEDQKKQILEQQRLIEELQFKSTHSELQKQLAEQRLVLQKMSNQMEATEKDLAKTENKDETSNKTSNKPSVKSDKSRPKSAVQYDTNTPISTSSSSSKKRPQSAVITGQSTKSEHDTTRSGATTDRTSVVTSRTDVSRPSSYTSTASEKSKYLKVLKNMEDRAAERSRLKKEREDRRRKAEDERLLQLEAEAEARKREEEEEKKARAEAYRERKRLEKQREAERLLQEEKLKQQNELADKHYLKSLMKYRGLLPMMKYVALGKQQDKMAVEHFETTLQRKTLLAWYEHVKEEWKEKEALADEMSNFLAVKHCFQSWRLHKHHMIIQDHKAKLHYETMMKNKILQAWRDYANEEKVASWEKERRAREHYRRMLLKRHFTAWLKLPEEIEREKEREKRRAELRQKVASILPDFEPSTSVNTSNDFHH
ncbi:hypothetical protein ACF0H5_004292 [Mactra antiquata]